MTVAAVVLAAAAAEFGAVAAGYALASLLDHLTDRRPRP